MPDPIEPIPPRRHPADALTRDRTAIDPAALDELTRLDRRHRPAHADRGLRARRAADGLRRYGLISGFRRLAAFRALRADGLAALAEIPAFVRAPASIAAAMTAMVEENAIRADVSPWEQALLAVTARDRGLFDTVEAAIDALYASLSRDKRYRLRAIAHLVEELDGHAHRPRDPVASPAPPPRRRHRPRLRRR